MVFQTDAKGNWTFLSPGWEELTGHPIDLALNKYGLDYVHPDDREHVQARVRRLLTGESEFCRHEVRYRRRNGESGWVEVFVRLRFNADGSVAGAVGTMNDISERKAAEDMLRLAASVFANAGEGIIVTSAHGDIVDVNATFKKITGYSREEVLGKNPRFLSSGQQSKAFYEEMWQSLKSQGCWSGEVWNRRKAGECYVERLTITGIRDEDGVLTHYVGLFSDITSQKIQAEHLEHIAHYDPLTGLPNRRLLADRLQQSMLRARRNDSSVAVAYLDLDGFKAVNDQHGHKCGDELLVAIARKIQNMVRESDTVCRLGGDEFVIVFDNIKSFQDCQPLIVRLLGAVSEPIIIGGQTLHVTGSVGISLYPQNEDIDADQLMRQADQAMYKAKMAGKDRFCLFDSLDYRNAVDRIEELETIRRAMANQEFALHYQPIIELRSGALNSVEALVRWNHPTRGCLSPAEFLPALEGHPLMLALENWILEEAAHQHERWLDAGLDVAVSVNLSAAQLHRKDFVSFLQALLAKHPQIKPRRLKLEVLETSALNDLDHVSSLMAACGDLGVSFSLDDFGTGYSSLRYLKQLPAKRIKIDQGFVRDMLEDPDDLSILEGVIGMAAAFKREVIAEGVETIQHAHMLIQLGCTMAQGYGIARPMPAEALIPWAAEWRLPQELTNCRALERGDTLLLKALVENRAWYAKLLAHVQDRSKRCPGAQLTGLAVLESWLALCNQRHARCAELVREVCQWRAQLGELIDRVIDQQSCRATDDIAVLHEFEQANSAYASALACLINA